MHKWLLLTLSPQWPSRNFLDLNFPIFRVGRTSTLTKYFLKQNNKYTLFFLFEVMRLELRALNMLRRCSTTTLYISNPLFTFHGEDSASPCCIYRLALNLRSSTFSSQVTRITETTSSLTHSGPATKWQLQLLCLRESMECPRTTRGALGHIKLN